MHVERHPAVVEHLVPDAGGRQELNGRHTFGLYRGVHERRGTVDHEERNRSDQVQEHAKRNVTRLLIPLPGIPRIEIHVEHEGLADEQQRIDHGEDDKEVIDQPGRELRISRQQHEDEETTGQRRHTIKNDRDLGDLFGQSIITGILLPVPQPLRDDHENGRPENKSCEQDVELSDDPDSCPIPSIREFNRRRTRRLCVGRPAEQR